MTNGLTDLLCGWNVLTPEATTILGRRVIPMLASGFTPQDAAALFLLPHQLMKPSDGVVKYLFPDEPEISLPSDKPMEDFRKTPISRNGPYQSLTPIGDVNKEASAYAYIAASVFRIFTKSPENYIKAWGHIISGYRKFYGIQCPVAPPAPNEEAIKSLAGYFSFSNGLRAALYRFLYTSSRDNEAGDLKRFLYEVHLANTGMHIVNIFVRLCTVLNCSSGEMLTAIRSRETERQVAGLVSMLNLLKSTDPRNARKMWRYGRLFDETFLADLQTKSCPKLVYILAAALRAVDPESNKNILQIMRLRDVSADNKIRCEAAAKKLVLMLTSKSTVKEEFSEASSSSWSERTPGPTK